MPIVYYIQCLFVHAGGDPCTETRLVTDLGMRQRMYVHVYTNMVYMYIVCMHMWSYAWLVTNVFILYCGYT